MSKRKQGKEWNNLFHEEALRRRQELNYMKIKKSVSEKYMEDISQEIHGTETPIDMNDKERV